MTDLTEKAAAARAATLAISCPICGAAAGELCTSTKFKARLLDNKSLHLSRYMMANPTETVDPR